MPYNRSRFLQVLYFLKYAVSARLSGKARRPLVCGFKVTTACNLDCMHCPFIKREKAGRTPGLDYEAVSGILDRLYRDGVRILIFEGGEPLLWKDRGSGKDISDLLLAARKYFFFTCITTNGTISLDIPADIVFVSLDGLKETHNRIRGDVFDLVMSNIEKAHDKKKIIVNTCISRLNFMEIPRLVKFLEDKVFGVTVQFFYPYSEVENLGLSRVQKEQVLEELIGLKDKGYSILDSRECLKKMKDNSWKCRDFLIASVEADGTITQGCYLKNRTENISCRDCGFSAHCEVSLAYDLYPGAVRAARDIFWN